MKISIITVCYNSEVTIEKTLQSVANQTYSNIEYIIIDGQSKDNTLKIIEKYKDVVSYLVSEPDKGLYDAMNKGIQLATGDYVGIINSDDTFFSNDVISDEVVFLTKNKIDASIGNIVQHNEQGDIKRIYKSKNWLPDKLKVGFMPPHPSIFFKRSLFDKFGFYHLDFKIAADYELIIRYFLKYKISWKYSGITTTSMLIGGLSSSGLESYNKVTEEINIGLTRNDIKFSKFKVVFRIVWKIFGWLK